jgi:NAD(P)-dependent dehydrogenase (short-subunit alcohol dehydrogenase family)
MQGLLEGKVIIVTGAGAGIGRASALNFSHAGARIVVVDRDEVAGQETLGLLKTEGGSAIFCKTDVSSESDVIAMVDAAVAEFGCLDGAFNNAGVEGGMKRAHELSLDEWQKTISVDLTGVFLCMKYEITAMLKCGGGSIVNTSSGLGVVGMQNLTDYVAAKHGVIGLTKAAGIDYGPQGIRVNAILPGLTLTPMIKRTSDDPAYAAQFEAIRARHPIGRFAQPEDIAEGAKWLLSDASAYVTAASIPVDGGYIAI